MEITLGEATKLLDNIMTNYSQWHTEQTPISKKVNSVEEINTLSDKMDALMKLVASKSAHIDPNDVPLSTLIEKNNDAIDVNFVSRNNFNNNAYRGNFNPRPFPGNSPIIMVIPMVIHIIIIIIIIIGYPLILKVILKNLLILKRILML